MLLSIQFMWHYSFKLFMGGSGHLAKNSQQLGKSVENFEYLLQLPLNNLLRNFSFKCSSSQLSVASDSEFSIFGAKFEFLNPISKRTKIFF